MKATCQLIHKEDGTRSPAFFVELKDLPDLLTDSEVPEDDYILVVAVQGEENFATAPLITVKTFKDMHKIQFADQEETNG